LETRQRGSAAVGIAEDRTKGTPVSEGETRERIELDRAAWSLPVPPPDEVRLPPADNWPLRPFVAAGERVGPTVPARRPSREPAPANPLGVRG